MIWLITESESCEVHAVEADTASEAVFLWEQFMRFETLTDGPFVLGKLKLASIHPVIREGGKD